MISGLPSTVRWPWLVPVSQSLVPCGGGVDGNSSQWLVRQGFGAEVPARHIPGGSTREATRPLRLTVQVPALWVGCSPPRHDHCFNHLSCRPRKPWRPSPPVARLSPSTQITISATTPRTTLVKSKTSRSGMTCPAPTRTNRCAFPLDRPPSSCPWGR